MNFTANGAGLAATPQAASDWSDVALFLDFDGTLVELAPMPDKVAVDEMLVPTLAALRLRMGGALAIVSGRQIEAIDRFLAPERFDAAGLHGQELRLAGTMLSTSRRNDALDAVRAALRRLASEMPGVIVEDKPTTVALHWREAPAFEARAIGAIAQAAAELGPEYRVQHGKSVAEIVESGADKGTALRRFLEAPPYQRRRPVVLGDDLTDEAAFEAAAGAGGFGVKVGAGPSVASYRLGSPREVRTVLRALLDGEPLRLLANEEMHQA